MSGLLALWFWIVSTAIAQAATASANLSVQIVQPSAVARSDGTWDGTASTGTTDATLTLNNPVPNGATVFVALLYESCFNPSSQPGCVTAGGNLDQIKVGNNIAYDSTHPWLGHWQDARYSGDGLGLTVAWVKNVSGNPTTVDIISTSGGLWYDGAVVSVFTGIPGTATVDGPTCAPNPSSGTPCGANGGAFATGGPLGTCCASGVLGNTSGVNTSVTPTQSGDFLYGVGVAYGCGPPNLSADTNAGWSGSNASTNYFGKVDEWRIYNSTSAISATFPSSCGDTSEYVATVAVKMH